MKSPVGVCLHVFNPTHAHIDVCCVMHRGLHCCWGASLFYVEQKQKTPRIIESLVCNVNYRQARVEKSIIDVFDTLDAKVL